MMNRILTLTYRTLLRAFPSSIRDRFGADMVQLLNDHLRDARSAGRSVVLVCLSAVWDTLAQGTAARWATRRSARRERRLAETAIRNNVDPNPSGGSRGWRGGRRSELSSILQDIRQTTRYLLRSPAFAIPAIFTLALGVGANTAVFTVLDHVALRPLPYEAPDRLVRLLTFHSDRRSTGVSLTGPEYLEHREQIDAFEATTAIYTLRPVSFTLTGQGVPQRVTALRVAADYFDVYRVSPILGRGFLREEETPPLSATVISYRLYSALSSEGDEILGSRILLDDQSVDIVGVMPPAFRDVVGGDVDLWTPLDMVSAASGENGHYLSEVARLRPEVSIAEAQAQIDAYQANLDPERPEWRTDIRKFSTRVVPLRSNIVGDVDRILLLLFCAAGLVLLIACMNVANFFLARNVVRAKELAVRSALGSSRYRLARHLLVESGIVALLGGSGGVFVAFLGVEILLALAPPDLLPRIHEVSLDERLLVFALGVSVLTALLFGLFPALHQSSQNPNRSLWDSSRTASTGGRSGLMQDLLVVCQVTLALVLMVGTGLFLRSMVQLITFDLGITATNVATVQFHLPRPRYREWSDRVQLHRGFQERMESISGVAAAGAVSWLPVSGGSMNWGRGYVNAEGEREVGPAEYRAVEGQYFKAMGIPLIKGRLFEETDDSRGQPVVIINQEMERRYFGDTDPLAKEVFVGRREAGRIVGVVGDVAQDPRGTVAPQVYMPHSQAAQVRSWDMTHVVATETPRDDIFEVARRELATLDPNLVVHSARRMDDIVASALARDTFALFLIGIFASVAALVAGTGIYGTLSYRVSRRRQEMGIRIALGAMARDVRMQVLRRAGWLLTAGLIFGLSSAFALSRLLASLLFEVSERDPLVFILTPLAFIVIGLVAAWFPAHRATTVDPVRVLGSD
jgi:putative ABC transport system permease protein